MNSNTKTGLVATLIGGTILAIGLPVYHHLKTKKVEPKLETKIDCCQRYEEDNRFFCQCRIKEGETRFEYYSIDVQEDAQRVGENLEDRTGTLKPYCQVKVETYTPYTPHDVLLPVWVCHTLIDEGCNGTVDKYERDIVFQLANKGKFDHIQYDLPREWDPQKFEKGYDPSLKQIKEKVMKTINKIVDEEE